jgi:hypothetical protein
MRSGLGVIRPQMGVAFVVAIAALLREIAAWQMDLGRDHQAAASTAAAGCVAEWAVSDLGATVDIADHASDRGPVYARPRTGCSPCDGCGVAELIGFRCARRESM